MRMRLIQALCIVLLLAALQAGAFGASGDAVGDEPTLLHRMMMLVIQVGVILFAAKLGSILFEKIGIPGVLGELAAGILIGPYALGRLHFYGFPQGVFPFPIRGDFPITPELYGLSCVAAIVLLFTVGLETDLKLLLRYAVAGGLVGLGGVVFSFFLGAASAKVFSAMLFGHALSWMSPACLFLGAITTATSVSIPARILAERKKLDSPEGVTILSAAVIDDVLGIIVLAVVMGIVSASKAAAGSVDWGHIGFIGARAVGIWLIVTALALITSRRISFLLKWFGEPSSIAIMALGLAMIMSGLFEEAGLAMIIGAYVMGLSLSQADISRVVREKLTAVYALLIPLFFCVTGMMIDVTALASPSVLLFGAVFSVLALLAKVLGCGLPALLVNFNLRGAARIGLGMAPRGEVALIIAGVGLSAGVVESPIMAAVVLMILVNTILAPPVMVLLFRSDAAGTRKPVPVDRAAASVSFQFPSVEMADYFIGKLTEVFDSEGFFVHELSHAEKLHQLRKDRTVIDFQLRDSTLVFHCRIGDVPLVNTAMNEALAALEYACRGLREPLDAMAIRPDVLEAGPAPASLGLNLGHYLSAELVRPDLKGRNKGEIIDELLDVLHRQHLLEDVDAARKAVWQREESMPTGLQYGVAIPHGKSDAVDRLVCAIGVHKKGVDFGAMDRQPSRIIILTLSPRSKPAPHVQFMASVTQVLNSAGRQKVLSARGARQIYSVFRSPPLPEAPTPPSPARKPLGEFKLVDYIRSDLLRPRLEGNTKEEVIAELTGLLQAAGLVRDAAAAGDVILDREEQLSTGMGEGLAIPHGRTTEVDRLVCAVGVKPEGVEFGSADGKPARIIVLVLTPEGGADPYLQFAASVMAALDAAGRQRVLAATTSQELHQALTRETRSQ